MRGLKALPLLALILAGCQSAAVTKPEKSISPELQAQYNAAFQERLRDPSNLDVAFKFAKLATRAHDFEGAVATYQSMLLVNSDLPQVQLELGILYFRLKSYATSRAYLEQALRSPSVPADVRDPAQTLLARMPKRARGHGQQLEDTMPPPSTGGDIL